LEISKKGGANSNEVNGNPTSARSPEGCADAQADHEVRACTSQHDNGHGEDRSEDRNEDRTKSRTEAQQVKSIQDADTDQKWDCVRVSSPAGKWYLSKDDDVERLSVRADGTRRAVFSRDELVRINGGLKSANKEDRQELLRCLIDLKEVIGGKVQSVSNRSIDTLKNSVRSHADWGHQDALGDDPTDPT